MQIRKGGSEATIGLHGRKISPEVVSGREIPKCSFKNRVDLRRRVKFPNFRPLQGIRKRGEAKSKGERRSKGARLCLTPDCQALSHFYYPPSRNFLPLLSSSLFEYLSLSFPCYPRSVFVSVRTSASILVFSVFLALPTHVHPRCSARPTLPSGC